jgi:protein XagA
MRWVCQGKSIGLSAQALLAVFVLPCPAFAGAWTQPAGRGQIIFSSVTTEASQRYGRNGKPRASGRFSKQELQAAAEYGTSDTVTLLAGTAARYQSVRAETGRLNAVNGAILGGARIRLWAGEASVLSLQASAEATGERQLPGTFRRLNAPVEADARLLFGHGFSLAGMTGFVDLQTAYRFRNSGNADEVRFDATLGIRPLPKWLLLLQSFNTFTLGRDTRFNLPATRQNKLQASVVYDLTEQFAVQAGVFTSAAGRETLRERGVVTALWWRF